MSTTPTFAEDLRRVINLHSKENGSNTPDFILAEYLRACLDAFEIASNHRESWYGTHLHIGPPESTP